MSHDSPRSTPRLDQNQKRFSAAVVGAIVYIALGETLPILIAFIVLFLN